MRRVYFGLGVLFYCRLLRRKTGEFDEDTQGALRAPYPNALCVTSQITIKACSYQVPCQPSQLREKSGRLRIIIAL